MKKEKTVLRIPLFVPIAIALLISILLSHVLEIHTISNPARYTTTNASTTEDGNFEYQELEDGTIEITDYVGTDTEVVIPETIEGKTVTSIAGWTFAYCEEVTNIAIPSTVTNIGTYYTFHYCSSLTSINVDSNNTKFISEDGILFNKEKTEILRYPPARTQTEYIIPEGVINIGVGAFEYCLNLTSVHIPGTVITIKDDAFEYCDSLRKITIEEGLTTIGYGAFYGCYSLKTINLPESLTEIQLYAFGETSLKSIEIPKNVISIEDNVWSCCTKLTEITVNSNNTAFTSEDGILFNKDKTRIISYPAGKEDTKYTIPDGITCIGVEAFGGCENLTEIKIPETVTTIEAYAFSYCYGLKNIEIPDSVTKVGQDSFTWCDALQSIKVGSGVENIESYAFYGCKNLYDIQISEEVTSIENYAFREAKIIRTINLETSTTQEIELPSIIKRAMDENDILNSSNITFKNCSLNGDKIIVDVEKISTETVEVIINSGLLNELSLEVVPSGTITYYDTYMYDKAIATLHIADGETIANNNGENRFCFDKNGEFSFEYTDVNGNVKTSKAVVDYLMEFTYEGNYLADIPTQMTIEELATKLALYETETIKVYDKEQQELSGDDIVGTGMKLEIINEISETEKYTYDFILVIKGDVNGDGESNFKDMAQINSYRLSKKTLSEEAIRASDVTGEGIVDFKDLVKVNKYRLNKITEL